jgi:hypothetical protein
VIVLLAVAMGVQNATARKLAVPDLTTTVLTFAEMHRRNPHARQVGTLRLQHGVITDESTTVTFCATGVDRCGL